MPIPRVVREILKTSGELSDISWNFRGGFWNYPFLITRIYYTIRIDLIWAESDPENKISELFFFEFKRYHVK